MTIIQQRILPITNPNYNLKETPQQLIDLLNRHDNIPITTNSIKDGTYHHSIGVICSKNNYFYEKDGFIWGNITIMDDTQNTSRWKNAMVDIDKNMNIIKIVVVQYGDKEE